MSFTILIVAFAAIILTISALTLFGTVAGWLRRRHDDATPDPVIADSKDQFDPK
jgi:hypothetical protein